MYKIKKWNTFKSKIHSYSYNNIVDLLMCFFTICYNDTMLYRKIKH